MGAQGIRRRKPRRERLDSETLPPGDAGRLFGRFTWGPYSPAGNLERNGFFLRQLKRNGTRGAWAFVAQAKWVFLAVAVGIGGITLVTYLVHLGP
jgi:hypothetical protein